MVLVTLPGGQTITAVHHPAAGALPEALEGRGWTFIYAPGAGSNINDPFGRYLCERLAAAGVDAYRFQFLYMEQGRRSPDRAPTLEAAWRAVIEHVAGARPGPVEGPSPAGSRLAAGGRSMGGRYASIIAAGGAPVDALGLFAYPLHAPGDPRWRVAHFPDIKVPTLFCSGTNDAFATPEELKTAAGQLANAQLHFLEGADHGFSVPKASGRTRQEVYQEAVDALIAWLTSL